METIAIAYYKKYEIGLMYFYSNEIYPLIAGKIIKDGWIIFTIYYDDLHETMHKRIDSLQDIEFCQYVQAHLYDTFNAIKIFLQDQCLDNQCAGFIKYLEILQGKNIIGFIRDSIYVIHVIRKLQLHWRRHHEYASISGN